MSRKLIVASLALLVLQTCAMGVDARPRHYTITQRQNELSMRIRRGERANELTAKEAAHLREDIADVKDREARMRSKNGGKLSYKDMSKIEKDLNDISVALHKKELNKRIDR